MCQIGQKFVGKLRCQLAVKVDCLATFGGSLFELPNTIVDARQQVNACGQSGEINFGKFFGKASINFNCFGTSMFCFFN